MQHFGRHKNKKLQISAVLATALLLAWRWTGTLLHPTAVRRLDVENERVNARHAAERYEGKTVAHGAAAGPEVNGEPTGLAFKWLRSVRMRTEVPHRAEKASRRSPGLVIESAGCTGVTCLPIPLEPGHATAVGKCNTAGR